MEIMSSIKLNEEKIKTLKEINIKNEKEIDTINKNPTEWHSKSSRREVSRY